MQAFTSCISTSLVLVLLGLVVLFTMIARKLSNSVRENLVVTVLLVDDATEKQIGVCAERLKNRPYKWLESDALVADVVYQQDLVENLNRNLQRVGIILLVLALLLTFVSFGLINSMVKMSLYANRFLIHTMKLVGARWGFIRRPFLARAFKIGLIAALLADGVLIGGLYVLLQYDPTLSSFVTQEMILVMSLAVFAFGVLITLFCSYLSLNKFLRMKAGELYEM